MEPTSESGKVTVTPLTPKEQVPFTMQQASAGAAAAAEPACIDLGLGNPDQRACQRFSGAKNENVRLWFVHLEQYFMCKNPLSERYRVYFAASLFQDSALIWWDYVVKTNAAQGHPEWACTWENFKNGVIEKFSDPNAVRRARDRIFNLRQKADVASYGRAFTTLVAEITDMNEAEKMDKFTRGLKPEVQKMLALSPRSQDLLDLMQRAEAIDSVLYYNRLVEPKNANWFAFDDSKPMEIDAMTTNKLSNNQNRTNNGYIQRSKEELNKLKEQRACFKCGEPGHIARRCPKN